MSDPGEPLNFRVAAAANQQPLALLVKRFDGFTAVDHISFAVPEGVIFGFLVPTAQAGRRRSRC